MRITGKYFLNKLYLVGSNSLDIYKNINILCENIKILDEYRDIIIPAFDNDEVDITEDNSIFTIKVDDTLIEIHTIQLRDLYCIVSRVFVDNNLYSMNYIADGVVDLDSAAEDEPILFYAEQRNGASQIPIFLDKNDLNREISNYLTVTLTDDSQLAMTTVGDLRDAINLYNENKGIESYPMDESINESLSDVVRDKSLTIDLIGIKDELLDAITTYIYDNAVEEIHNPIHGMCKDAFKDVCDITIEDVEEEPSNFVGQLQNVPLLQLTIKCPFDEEALKVFRDECLNPFIQRYNDTAAFDISEDNPDTCQCMFYITSEEKLHEFVKVSKTKVNENEIQDIYNTINELTSQLYKLKGNSKLINITESLCKLSDFKRSLGKLV